MKKGRELRNLPVIKVSTGQILGYVDDVFIDKSKKITGISIKDSETNDCSIPWENIRSWGRDAVLVDIEENSLATYLTKSSDDNNFMGSWVLTTSGKNLGAIEDVMIEEQTGTIVGYEITDGYIKDLLLGRKVIFTEEIITQGEDVYIMKDEGS